MIDLKINCRKPYSTCYSSLSSAPHDPSCYECQQWLACSFLFSNGSLASFVIVKICVSSAGARCYIATMGSIQTDCFDELSSCAFRLALSTASPLRSTSISIRETCNAIIACILASRMESCCFTIKRNSCCGWSYYREWNRGLVKSESVGVVMQNCKQRAMQTRAKDTEITATTAAAMRAKKWEQKPARKAGKKVAYHHGEKSQNCGFCVSKLESTIGTMLYSHLHRYVFTSIQTNVGQINLHYLECSIQ